MKPKRLISAIGLFWVICAGNAAAQMKTTDRERPKATPASSSCSLRVDQSTPFDVRKKEYLQCVHDKMGPESDAYAKENVRGQELYEYYSKQAEDRHYSMKEKKDYVDRMLKIARVER